MLVEKGDSFSFRMGRSIMSVIIIVINVDYLFGILKHPKASIFTGTKFNMNRTCSVCGLQDSKSVSQIISLIHYVSENISPWVPVPGHLDRPFWWKPHLLSQRNFG